MPRSARTEVSQVSQGKWPAPRSLQMAQSRVPAWMQRLSASPALTPVALEALEASSKDDSAPRVLFMSPRQVAVPTASPSSTSPAIPGFLARFGRAVISASAPPSKASAPAGSASAPARDDAGCQCPSGGATTADMDSGDETDDGSGSDDSDGCEPGVDDDDHERTRATPRGQRTSTGHLWGKAQFPEGQKKHACWDWANIQAAQAWSCPCEDRRSCIGQERMKPEALLIHRKEFQTRASHMGNMRDSTRDDMACHFNTSNRSMSHTHTHTRTFAHPHTRTPAHPHARTPAHPLPSHTPFRNWPKPGLTR